MSLLAPQIRHYEVEFLTEHFLFRGAIEPVGQMMTFLNDPDRRTLLLKQAGATGLDPGSTLDRFQADELWFRRDEIIAIRPLDPVSSGTMPLMPRAEKLRVFVPRFVVQATFHCGPDTRLGDIFDLSGFWAPATDALVHHLLPPKHQVFHDARVLLINKRHVRFYQALADKPAA